MSLPPTSPKIYHIVHVDRLASILRSGCLLSEAIMARHTNAGTMIGMSRIKARRMVRSLDGDMNNTVGMYVPFYFCPRSVMLYVIFRANSPDLEYHGGQGPIIHLRADLHEVVKWAEQVSREWAFSLGNAGANATEFRFRASQLDQLNWRAISARDFRLSDVRDAKQSEFLVRQDFPWALVQEIGVHSEQIKLQVENALSGQTHRPLVSVRGEWYY